MPYHGHGMAMAMLYHYVMHNKNKHLFWAFVYCISFVCDLQLLYVNMVFFIYNYFNHFVWKRQISVTFTNRIVQIESK